MYMVKNASFMSENYYDLVYSLGKFISIVKIEYFFRLHTYFVYILSINQRNYFLLG